jgi:hypothetical protein
MNDGEKITYCIGTGGLTKCKTCQHENTWNELNQMPDVLRQTLQANASRIDGDECGDLNGCHYRQAT